MFAEKLFNEIAEKKDSGITFEVGIRIYLELMCNRVVATVDRLILVQPLNCSNWMITDLFTNYRPWLLKKFTNARLSFKSYNL